jgi:hypothetical protein
MPRPCMLYTVALVLVCTGATRLAGQTAHLLSAPKKGKIDNLCPVVVPAATFAALHEDLRMLAFGHERWQDSPGQVSLVRLDAQGRPAVHATTWKLPRPEALAKFATYPVGLAFHPKLPLLYVWQDTAVQYDSEPRPRNPILAGFDHLLVYDVSKEPPALTTSLCRGEAYMNGQQGGGLAVDSSGTLLYVPNLRDVKSSSPQIGRLHLDADGLPDVLGDGAAKLPREERCKKIAERVAAGPVVPPEFTPAYEAGRYFTNTGFGSASRFVTIASEAVIAGGGNGIIMWRPGDKSCVMNSLPIKGVAGPQLVAHARLPVLFLTSNNSSTLHRLEHADGYPTLLPEAWALPERKLLGPPAVMARRAKMAVGGEYVVYLLSLDEMGRPTPDVIQMTVLSPAVRAMIYSERFDQLYVPVELSK